MVRDALGFTVLGVVAGAGGFIVDERLRAIELVDAVERVLLVPHASVEPVAVVGVRVKAVSSAGQRLAVPEARPHGCPERVHGSVRRVRRSPGHLVEARVVVVRLDAHAAVLVERRPLGTPERVESEDPRPVPHRCTPVKASAVVGVTVEALLVAWVALGCCTG